MAVQRAFLLSMVFVASALSPRDAMPQATADRRAVALQWDGIAGPVPGVLDLAPDGSGTLRFQMMKPERLCIGTISVIEGQRNGSWALACGDGMAASGRYLRQDRQALGEGKGTDTGGRAVSFAVGASLLPPAGAARPAPPVVEPQNAEAKKPEARKEEQTRRPAAATVAPPRGQAGTTADALNEAELHKARERNWESAVQGAIAPPRAPAGSGSTRPVGPDNQLTATELDGVTAQFKPCWNPNFGGRNAAGLVVEIEIYANPDGTIAQARPRPNIRLASDPFYQSAVDAAMRAVLRPQCGGIGGRPLPLPREKYEQWKAFVLVFDPKAMLGAKASGA
ncbi:MAG: cell envelope integrity protein TolA, partial [Rhodospirillales bacterium]|nr:cell envelope integrity protein TolA [Rhodospirillales bacterium]